MIKINENNDYEITIKDYIFTINSIFIDAPLDFINAFYELLIPYPHNKHSTSVTIAESDDSGITFVFSKFPLSEQLYIIKSNEYKNIIKLDISHKELAFELIKNIEKQYDLFYTQYNNCEYKTKFILNYNKLKDILKI